MDEFVSQKEHEEFSRRMEDEHRRINHRLKDLEETVREVGKLTASVEKLAQSVQQMAKSQVRQEERLEELEGRDGEMWRKVSGYVVTTLVGAILTFVLMQIGIR